MSQYSDAVAAQRAEMDQVESETNRRILKAYDDLIVSLDDDLEAITQQIERARDNGEDVHPDWLRRQARYTRLMDQLESSRITFEQTGQNIIDDVHGTAVERGAVHALQREQILFRGEDADIFSGNINMPAMENIIGQTGGTSPLVKVLESHGTGAADIITSGLVAGLSGQGADTIFRNIRRQLLSPTADSRLMALVRTEMMNAYRASMHEQYSRFDDEIDGWMWSAHRGPRTCLACLAMDGQVFPMDQPFSQAHVCCRCSASPWPKDLYPEVRKFLQEQGSGEAWLRRQPRSTQARMFPSKDSFEAFERGDLHLRDFVGHTDSPVWGRKVYALSGRQAMRKRGIAPPRSTPQAKTTPPKTTSRQLADNEIDAWAEPFAKPWSKYLKSWHFKALDNYRGHGYRPINGHLRFGNKIDQAGKNRITRIDQAIAGSTIPEAVTVYRGVGNGVFTNKSAVGDIYVDRGFMSTSLSKTEADKFVKSASNLASNKDQLYLMRISVPSGSNGAYMDVLNGMGGVEYHEKELLLPRNTTLVVTGIAREGDVTVVDLEVVP